jgi:hypothetical protein
MVRGLRVSAVQQSPPEITLRDISYDYTDPEKATGSVPHNRMCGTDPDSYGNIGVTDTQP